MKYAQIPAHFLEYLDSPYIALQKGLVNFARIRDGHSGFNGHSFYGRGRGILFDTAAAAAAARMAVGLDRNVPDLAGTAVGAAQRLAIDDNAAANARAECDQDRVLDVL